MSGPTFTFTRNPSVKVGIQTLIDSLVQADSEIMIFGHIGASAGSAAVGVPIQIENVGDPVLAATECATKFGAGAKATEMVLAAINGVLYSDLAVKAMPKIKVVPLANDATSANLATTLTALLAVAMPFPVFPYDASDTVAITAIRNHINAINANDRGENGQFGSTAFIASLVALASATPAGIAAAHEGIVIPYLRDLAGTKANDVHEVAAAVAALAAGNPVPFNSINGAKVGGLVSPTQAADLLTSGDAGSASLALDAGLAPLKVNTSGDVIITRLVTTRRPISALQETAYYDLQDWQVLYYLRKNAWALGNQPRYKQAKATMQKLQSLKSELIQVCKRMEDLEMLQHVDKFAGDFTVARQASNRNAAVYTVPVNVVPILANIGIGLLATTKYDEIVA